MPPQHQPHKARGDTTPEGPVAKAPRLGTKPRGAMVAAVARSGETVGLGLARCQRLPRLVGHDGVTEDDVEPRITSGRWLDLLTEPELLWRTPYTTSPTLKGKTRSVMLARTGLALKPKTDETNSGEPGPALPFTIGDGVFVDRDPWRSRNVSVYWGR